MQDRNVICYKLVYVIVYYYARCISFFRGCTLRVDVTKQTHYQTAARLELRCDLDTPAFTYVLQDTIIKAFNDIRATALRCTFPY